MQYASEDIVLTVNSHEGIDLKLICSWLSMCEHDYCTYIFQCHFSYVKVSNFTCHVIDLNFTIQCGIELKFSLKVPYYLLITLGCVIVVY